MTESAPAVSKSIFLTVLALISFAANSVLCRVALASESIDPASFTAIRLASGAGLLVLLIGVRSSRRASPGLSAGNWVSAGMLFAYAAAFSFAYVGLKAGTGALILFGCVQATMIVAAIAGKQHPKPVEWVGLVLALGGLIYLVLPGLSAPPLASALLMAVAGVAWGVYSLRGRTVSAPIDATAGNFLRAAPFGLLLAFAFSARFHGTPLGIFWAVLSGAVTSGLGYVMWYAALPSLGATRAAVVQLLVPVLAACGGVLLLGEALTLRLGIAGAATLSGVAIAIFGRTRR